MKKSILILLSAVLLIISCQDYPSAEERMSYFVNNYRDSFIKSDLTLYDYDPHAKFEYNNDSINIRYFIRSDRKMLISSFCSIKYLDSNNITQKFAYEYSRFLSRNEQQIIQSGISINWLTEDLNNILILLGDNNKSFPIPRSTFKIHPIDYFSNLDSLIGKYGILAIERNETYIRIIFGSKNSLLYLIDTNSINNFEIKPEKIDTKWYKSKETLYTDYY